MAVVKPVRDEDASPAAKAVFDDIRKTRNSDFVNNFWRVLAAVDEAMLASVWAEVKELMASETELDPLTKEMIYVAVSIANACTYCVHSHSAALAAKGVTPAQRAELLKIVALAAKTNHLANALQVPVDPEFEAPALAKPATGAKPAKVGEGAKKPRKR